MGWGNLRVINEDRIAPVPVLAPTATETWRSSATCSAVKLAHKDSMGNVKGIPPGDVQRMSAGSGVKHSEFNHAEG
jgi:redox-sensitive bicupin YhaK (pirin superfamily)